MCYVTQVAYETTRDQVLAARSKLNTIDRDLTEVEALAKLQSMSDGYIDIAMEVIRLGKNFSGLGIQVV